MVLFVSHVVLYCIVKDTTLIVKRCRWDCSTFLPNLWGKYMVPKVLGTWFWGWGTGFRMYGYMLSEVQDTGTWFFTTGNW